MRSSRRAFLNEVLACASAFLLFASVAIAQDDLLVSWSDGPAKQAIIEFVKATTDPASPKFVPPEARIATFDQDGTLWVEHPIYTQVLYCLDRVPVLVKEKPQLAEVEPFKTVLSGDHEAIAKLPLHDLFKILAATLSGMRSTTSKPRNGSEAVGLRRCACDRRLAQNQFCSVSEQ